MSETSVGAGSAAAAGAEDRAMAQLAENTASSTTGSGSGARARRRKPKIYCDNCGRKLKFYIQGKDLRLTDGKRRPRYCWPGEGCMK